MAAPTTTDIKALNFSYKGQPFCRIANSSMNTLDFSYQGKPFWALSSVIVITGLPIKRWSGSAWIDVNIKYFTGLIFATKPVKAYINGSWQTINT